MNKLDQSIDTQILIVEVNQGKKYNRGQHAVVVPKISNTQEEYSPFLLITEQVPSRQKPYPIFEGLLSDEPEKMETTTLEMPRLLPSLQERIDCSEHTSKIFFTTQEGITR